MNKDRKPIEMVNHPDHYKSGKMEVIDVIEEFTKDFKGTLAFDLGNVIKYVCRCKKKNGVEDLKKARWYLDHAINHWSGERDGSSSQI